MYWFSNSIAIDFSASQTSHVAELERVRTDCEERGATAETLSLDVTLATELKKQLTTLYDNHPFDLLIANAGIAGGTIEGYGQVPWEEMYHRVEDVNLIGTLNTIMPVFQKMKESRHAGQIASKSELNWINKPR